MLGRERTSQASSTASRIARSVPEYLTTGEATELLRLAPKTLRNKVASGVFVEGAHFFRKPGLGPRWKREALVRWLEDRELDQPDSMVEDVPLANSTGDAERWA